jgi:hypothetical protein
MLNSVNQIRVELQEIANAHLQINNFFWGDFLRAYKEDTELNYVLMGCFYPTASLLNNQTQLTLTIYICDRVYKDYSNLNDVESDTLSAITVHSHSDKGNLSTAFFKQSSLLI